MAPPSRSVSHRDALLELLWAPVERQSSERFDLLTSAEGITVARHNTVVLRAASRLRGFERPLPPEFLEMERLERARVATLLELVACVAEICRTLGVRFLFTKAFQHLPDMGHDVDLVLM